MGARRRGWVGEPVTSHWSLRLTTPTLAAMLRRTLAALRVSTRPRRCLSASMNFGMLLTR